MEFLAEWWWAIVAVIVVVLFVIAVISNNSKMKKTLLYLVTIAEKEMKSGTGELKIQSVYNSFIEKFPILSTFIPYATFKIMVDDALVEMQRLLDTNEAIDNYVNQ